MIKENPDDILKSWAKLNLWLAEQTDEKVVRWLLDKEMEPGRMPRPTIVMRIYTRFSVLRKQRELKELYSR